MKGAKRKDFRIEIWRSLNRFLSILFIVALGVAFFAGIRSTRPDMERSADQYYDDTNLMDIRIVGTLGLTEEDVEAVREIEGVKSAVGAYTADMLCDAGEQEQTVRMFSVTDGVNAFTVTEGRLPEKPGECLIDKGKLFAADGRIGDSVRVYPGRDEELEDVLNRDVFTIVGAGISSRYLSVERGTTSIGDGSLDGFMAVLPEDFSLEVYTDIYVLTEQGADMTAYSEAYDNYVEEIADRIDVRLSQERSAIRYEEVVKEANETLQEAREELEEKSREADEKLADAAKQIAEADEKIEEGKRDVEQGQKDLDQGKADLAQAERDLAEGKRKLAEKEQELADAKATLAEKEQELADARVKLSEGEQELIDGKNEVAEKEQELADGWEEFERKTSGPRSELEYGWEEYEYGVESYEAAKETLEEEKERLKDLKREYREAAKEMTEIQKQMMSAEISYRQQMISEGEKQLKQVKNQLDSSRKKLNRNQKKIDDAEDELYEGEEKLKEAYQKITDAEEKLEQARQDIAEADVEMAKAYQDIADGDVKIAEAHQEIRDGEAKMPKARRDIEKGEADIAEARKKLAEGEAELADAKIEYADAEKEAREKIADARKKIDDAQKDIDELKTGEWYVLDRNAIQTYVEYGSDAERIGAIGTVFPFIFFLVAALVSLTTMTRMVEEQRLQIGTLKALGYGKWSIASKYILYAFLATLAGSILGVAVGEKILPFVIMTAYFILYENLPVMEMPYQMDFAWSATGLAIGCTVAATVIASYKELLSMPAALMRPVPPRQGKRVALERITPLWKRMSFIQKATVRNLFRYKKRCLMTIFGIGGCMALLLVGFGLKDSISTLGERQYNDIWTYDAQVGLDEDVEPEKTEGFIRDLKARGMETQLRVEQSITDVTQNGVTKEAYFFVPEAMNQVEQFVHLRNRLSKEPFQIGDEQVLVTEKLAALLGVAPGDVIELKEGEDVRYPVEVGGVVENYLNHYVYMSPALYQKVYGHEPEYNLMFLKFDQVKQEDPDAMGTEILSYDAAVSVIFIGTLRGQINDMLDSLNVVIWVLIISAGLLAFVVLYNLNNININERLRELATIKVLGFYDTELAAYVYRENVMLTVLGSVVGAVMGYYLHRYVMLTVEVDMLMFGRQIRPVSYLYSVLLTCAFSAFVNGIMFFKLKKIDMVESLKSVE